MGRARQGLSIRSYAEHRGCDHRSVREAIAAGRLKKSIRADGRIKSAELADAEWAANTRSDHIPLSGPAAKKPPKAPEGEVSLGEARARLDLAKAELAELDLAERRGELVPAADVEAKMVADYSAVRTKMLGVPSRVRQQDPTLTAAQIALVESLIRESLETLSAEVVEAAA